MTYLRLGRPLLHLSRQLKFSQTCSNMGTASYEPSGIGGSQIGVQAPLAGGVSPSFSHSSRFHTSYGSLAFQALVQEVSFSITKLAVDRGFFPQLTGVYGPLFVVHMASGSWRCVLDLSSLNSFLVYFHETDRFFSASPG